jgi:hypothetical protein
MIESNQQGDSRIVFDLLDNWLEHPYLGSIREEVKRAYAVCFDAADKVTANSEGTLALAQSYGRSDVHLLPNGCDPVVFGGGPQYQEEITVGYGGKIGSRVDLDLIRGVVDRCPELRFEFAGPVLERRHLEALGAMPRVRLLGDVRYGQYPRVVNSWDIAWVPHRVGAEFGCDLIKLYEFRAAGLPTVMTPIAGFERALEGVRVVNPQEMSECLLSLARLATDGHVPREPHETPKEHTWEHKAEIILRWLESQA